MSSDHTSGLELRSLIKADGTLEVSLARVDIPEPGADPVRRRIRPHQLGEFGFQFAILADQRVIVGVANLRRVLVVVELVVMRDQLGEAHQPVGSFRLVHCISASRAAIFATLFMFRAVPFSAAGSLSFDWPTPCG